MLDHFSVMVRDLPAGAEPLEAHIAFTAPDRAAVQAFHDAAVAAGAEVLHAPQVWPEYHPTYFGASSGTGRQQRRGRLPPPRVVDSGPGTADAGRQAALAFGEKRTSSRMCSARASRSRTTNVGTVPPASKRATADWVMPAARASCVWLQPFRSRSSRTVCPSSKAIRAASYAHPPPARPSGARAGPSSRLARSSLSPPQPRCAAPPRIVPEPDAPARPLGLPAFGSCGRPSAG